MMENINTQKLAAHHVSPNLIDGIQAIPSEIEHSAIEFTTKIIAEVDGLPADLAENIRYNAEQRFLHRAAVQIPRGGRLAPAVSDVIAEVRETVRVERERMRPKSVAEVLKPWFGRLDEFGWRGVQKAAIAGVLQEGEEIMAADFHTVTTTGRTITQNDLREWTLGQRPRWQVDLPDSLRPSEYLAFVGFPTDEAIDERARIAEHVEDRKHIRTSGPAHLLFNQHSIIPSLVGR
jgi:hypothetical protein